MHTASEPSVPETALRTSPGVVDGAEEKRDAVRDGIRPLKERAEKAKEYYPMRDPEAAMPGGSSASESHPSSAQSIQHGLGHHGGPDSEPEVIVLEEEEREDEDHPTPIVVRVPRTPSEKEREAHEAAHLPHAEWCEFCVRGRARNRVHPSVSLRRQAESNKEEVQGAEKEAEVLPCESVNSVGKDPEEEAGGSEGGSGPRAPDIHTPKVSLDYFFLGDYATLKRSSNESF